MSEQQLFCVYDHADGERARFLMLAPLDVVVWVFRLRDGALERLARDRAEGVPTVVFFGGNRMLRTVRAIEIEEATEKASARP